MKSKTKGKVQLITKEYLINKINYLKNLVSLFDKKIPILAGFVFTSLIFYLSNLKGYNSPNHSIIVYLLFTVFILLIINSLWFSKIKTEIYNVSQIENLDELYIKLRILEKKIIFPYISTIFSFFGLIFILLIIILLIFQEISIILITYFIITLIYFTILYTASKISIKRLKDHLVDNLKKDQIGIERREKISKNF